MSTATQPAPNCDELFCCAVRSMLWNRSALPMLACLSTSSSVTPAVSSGVQGHTLYSTVTALVSANDVLRTLCRADDLEVLTQEPQLPTPPAQGGASVLAMAMRNY